jgi:hypothetical protein
MSRVRLHYTRAATARISLLPVEVRMHLETHLENLALLLEATPERLPTLLERTGDEFVTTVQAVRVLFTVDTFSRSLLVHRVESFPERVRRAAADGVVAEWDG